MDVNLKGLILLPLLLAGLGTATSQRSASTRFPGKLDAYFTSTARLTAAEVQLLVSGQPMTKLLAGDDNTEVALLGAVWINAPIRRYVDAVKDIENFERGGGFKVTRRVSVPPRLEDFAQLQLPQDDIDDIRGCSVGDCELKLGEDAIKRFRTQVKWTAPDANASANRMMRQLALEYVTGYIQGGNKRLAVYRDKGRPTFVADEFRSMIDAMPELTEYMPDVRRHLLEYPAFSLPQSSSFIYWQETEFGLKPTIRISHVTVREGAGGAIVVSKMLYASHYFWTGVELRALVPDPARGQGFWLVTVNRSRSDGLSGLTGTFVRGRARAEVQKSALAGLTSTKQKLEKP
jgi:hypothetical protein